MKYLLDTCVVSDFVKGEKNTLDKLKNVPPNEIAISSITVMEIQYGIALNPKYGKIIEPVILDLLASITVLDFNQNDAVQAAKIRALLKQEGQPIGSYDVLLAGTALNNQLIFVSSNTDEFNRINNLILENWRLALNH
jgi:tRNA(fMet)-specific endonuclease VapC